ncbi:uncharacterized protein LOC125190613 [Salvia hispanica]|uniref:uncharacterized protein LOC125190613 n=1 Tax=Salvia hispanica TaxID=49212 RepID=UPI002009C17E|nr:uncharacterized protein LOC125190613 [Salvia hispanica]XP_047943911.1 uncharacterized protein LOC125190613 [Salvia hispanica]XP_047943912.1 uncharacterized protein LOC125190613 [Salvia hispanica]
MVEKKLNFNQPILSVRKYSPKGGLNIVDKREGLTIIHWLPTRRPEANSGPMSNPGSVPFLWEQSPGRPKEEILAQSHNCASPSFDASSEPDVHEGNGSGANSLVLQRDEERGRVVDEEKAVALHCKPSSERGGSEQRENVITVCCLLPRSRLRSSVCSLNPVPAISRAMTFPITRMLSESALSGSSTDSESEVISSPVLCHKGNIASKLGESDEKRHGLEEAPGKQSFRTLQELLADDAVRIVERGDDVKTSNETKMIEDSGSGSGSESDQDPSSEDSIRLAVNKAAEEARMRLTREGVAPPPPQPPLPASPSDSWLSRTLAPASARKASSSALASRFSSKC